MNLPPATRDIYWRYGLALAFAALALAIRVSLPVLEGTAIYQLPLAAVVLSGWFGGRGPGLFALLLCAAGILYWFIPPVNSFHLPPAYALAFGIFICLGVLVSELSEGRRRAQAALEESERRFRLMAETVPEILWIESARPRAMLYMSPRYEQVWARPLGELKRDPETWMAAVHPEDRDGVISAHGKWLGGEADARFDMTFRIVRPDGDTRWIHSRATLIRDEQGAPYRGSGIAEDITEQRRAQEALARTQGELAHVARLTTLGELTSSIVHEVSQPLGAMIARAAAGVRWLAAEPPEIGEARAALDNIASDGKRARDVVARIRALTKGQAARNDMLDINHELREVVSLMEHELRSHDVVVRTELEHRLPRILGDRVQLQQVLLNLIVNAVDAMSGVHDRARELAIVSRRDPPDGLLIEVRDSGAGLAAEEAERVFEAFYTTKPEGVGIGLSISRSIVKAHGGRLWAGANEPHGAVFRFSLPVAAEALS